MRFLVAIDGSVHSVNALTHALELAAASDGSVTAVHAVDPAVHETTGEDPGGGPAERADRFVMESEADAEALGERVLVEALEGADADGYGVQVDTELLYGDPRETIPDLASEEGYDGLVVGHRGLTERQERVLGSVAKGFVERAQVPVTVVG
jgi:nucleotide-binding universal stress UspA family protein